MTRYVIIPGDAADEMPRVAVVVEEDGDFGDGELPLDDPSLPQEVREGKIGQVFDENGNDVKTSN